MPFEPQHICRTLAVCAAALACTGAAAPQTAGHPASLPNAPVTGVSLALPQIGFISPLAPATSGAVITLDEALTRARANEPMFNAAVAASRSAALDRSIARAALLPSVVYHNQFAYTEGARYAHTPGSAGNPVRPGGQTFVANNGVHEYTSQLSAAETIGLQQFTALSRATALAAVASAELEISRRGLTSTVVGLFYASSTAQAKVGIQQRALAEADNFVTQTQQREAAREAAHADVIKAQLTQQQRQRDLSDALLAVDRARLDLGVLLFPDPRTPYTVGLPAATPLPAQPAVETAAMTNNPELRSALSSLQARTFEVTSAQGAYLPGLVLNYSYGIDAPQFAVNGRRSAGSKFDDATRNLGYAASATLDIPIFDWFATPNRIRQARIQRDAAKTVLSSAQRTLVAQLQEFYAEAIVAQSQLDSLALSVRTAQESLRLTRLRYTSGEATVLEVVDAQNSLTQAELALADGTVRYHLSLANLQTLTGTI